MKSNLKILEKLPFAASFHRDIGSCLTIKNVNRHLGTTLYPRLAAIYQNVLEALCYSNSSYLKKNAMPQLYEALNKRRDYHKKLGLKMKINQPTKKLLPLKNFLLQQRVYRTDTLYIAIVAKVFFGSGLGQPNCVMWRIGRNRVLLWNRDLSTVQNVLSWYKEQIYQFRVRYQSNLYIRCVDSNNCEAYPRASSKEDLQEDVVTSQFLLRSSNDRFDWTLVDINGIVQNYQKPS